MSAIPPKQTVTGTDSVRMNTATELPPVDDGAAVPVTPQPDFSASSALVTMHNAASQSGGDAFPVLKAFQDYLETERQRARQRMVILSAIFAIIFIAVIGAFIAIWFSTMKDMRATNAQLLQAAIAEKNKAENPQPVVIPQPVQPSAEETARIIADTVTKVQAEQSAAYTKTLESLNASLSAVQKANAEMKAEIENRKAAEKAAAEKAAAEKAAREAAEKLAAEKAAREAAEKAIAEKLAAEKAAAEKAAAEKAAAEKAAAEKAAADLAAKKAAEAAKPKELVVPKFPAPPPVEGYSQSSMGIKLPKESAPFSWRIYLPEH